MTKQTANYNPGTGSMTFAVIIIQTRSSYGRIDCLIRPVSGEGEQWVSESKLIIS